MGRDLHSIISEEEIESTGSVMDDDDDLLNPQQSSNMIYQSSINSVRRQLTSLSDLNNTNMQSPSKPDGT